MAHILKQISHSCFIEFKHLKFIFSTFFVMIEGKRKILKKLDQSKLYYDEYPNQVLGGSNSFISNFLIFSLEIKITF